MQRRGSVAQRKFYSKLYEMSYFHLIDYEDSEIFSGKVSEGLARRVEPEHSRLSVENAMRLR